MGGWSAPAARFVASAWSHLCVTHCILGPTVGIDRKLLIRHVACKIESIKKLEVKTIILNYYWSKILPSKNGRGSEYVRACVAYRERDLAAK